MFRLYDHFAFGDSSKVRWQKWTLQWRGFGATFEIVPVVNSKETREVVAPYVDKSYVRTHGE